MRNNTTVELYIYNTLFQWENSSILYVIPGNKTTLKMYVFFFLNVMLRHKAFLYFQCTLLVLNDK